MSSPTPTPTPTPSPTSAPTSSPSPAPISTPSPSPGPTPVPSVADMLYNLAMPNVPANTYQLLSVVADAIDTANGSLGKSATSLSDIQGKTHGAVQNVSSTSQGRTTDALVTTWTNTQTDFSNTQHPLTTITTSGYMGGSPNPLRSVLDANKAALQDGLTAMASLQAMQNSCPVHPPTAQEVSGLIQQVDALTGALGNVSLAIDAMAMAIHGLNSGISGTCATGFVPGMPHPVFSTQAFSQSSTDSSGSGKSTTTAQEVGDSILANGGSEDAATFIPLLAEEQGLNLDNIQALLNANVDPQQMLTWLEEGKFANDTSVTDTTRLTTLLSSRGGDATQIAGWTQGLDADQLASLEARAEQNPKMSSDDLMQLTDPKLQYETNPKHLVKRPGVGPEPADGQRALNNSVSYKPTTQSRVGIDTVTNQIVVLDDTNDGTYHGHVETWKQLDQDQQNALTNDGFIDKRGRIIIRDSQGNIIGYGINVTK